MVKTLDKPAAAASGDAAGPLRTDSLAASIALLVGVTAGQRVVGLVRNVLFCALLDQDQLGRWSLAYHFLLLAAPLVVLGLPGSFGRYVEHFRQRGQLRTFLRRTAGLCAALTLGAATLLLAAPGPAALVLFGDAARWPLIPLLAAVLAAVVGFNFLVELLTALRLVRIASLMQFCHTVLFAIAGCGLLILTPLREQAAIAAYGMAAAAAALAGLWLAAPAWRAIPAREPPLAHRHLWGRLLPFAGWMWIGNLIGNLFEFADQFMLKYFSGLPASTADALVGQYYASRIVPILMVGLAAMLASCLLPHLIRHWEVDERRVAERQINLAVKLIALSFTATGALVLLVIPPFFRLAFGDKYDVGMAVLPATLTYCVWFSAGCVAQSYLLCVERARLGSLALLAGLLVNGVLNYLLAPRFALAGVVAATVVANGIALTLLFALGRLAGMRWSGGAVLACVFPLALLLGPWPAAGVLAAAAYLGLRRNWLLDHHDMLQVAESLKGLCRKLGLAKPGHQPASM